MKKHALFLLKTNIFFSFVFYFNTLANPVFNIESSSYCKVDFNLNKNLSFIPNEGVLMPWMQNGSQNKCKFVNTPAHKQSFGPPPTNPFPLSDYNCSIYAEAFQKVGWMLDGMRAGNIINGVRLANQTVPNRILWRGNSYMNDGNSLNTSLAPDPDTRVGRARADGTPILHGGWYDAGDPPKWSPGMADAATMLAWGGIEYPNAYTNTGEMVYLKANLKWVNDYFLRCFRYNPSNPNNVAQYRIYLVVGGSGGLSGPDVYQGSVLTTRPQTTLNEQEFLSTPHETAELAIKSAMGAGYNRPIYYADAAAPATQTVAKIAASMAAASVIFRDGINDAYSDSLLNHAKMLLNFCDTYIGGGRLKNRNGDMVDNIMGGGYWDGSQFRFWQNTISRCWASVWIHAAELEKNPSYGTFFLAKAIKYTDNSVASNSFPVLFTDGSRGNFFHQAFDGWGAKGKFYDPEHFCYLMIGKYVNLNSIVPHTENNGSSNGTTYGALLQNIAEGTLERTITTASGLPDSWSSHLILGDIQRSAFAMFVYADKLATNATLKTNCINWAEKIVDYTLGSNPSNRTYMTGIVVPGKTVSPGWVLHGPTQGFWDGSPDANTGSCDLDYGNTAPRHKHYGGITSPNYDNSFTPLGYSGNNHEIGPIYQSGINGSLARMVENLNCNSPLTPFAPAETSDGLEYYVRVNSTICNTNSIQTNLSLVNHSAWIAQNRNRMSFRYYFRKANSSTVTATLGNNTAPANYQQANYSTPGVVLTGPFQESGTLHYIVLDFTGINIFPGGRARPSGIPNYEKKVNFTLTSSAAWLSDVATNILVYGFTTQIAAHSVLNTCNTVTCTSPPPPLAALKDSNGVVLLSYNLLDFSAHFQANNQVLLRWQTISNAGLSHFIVERSQDGRVFSSIGEQKINSQNGRQTYNLTDPQAIIGKSYYRLRQIFENGKHTISSVQMVESEKLNKATFQIYPNPTDGKYKKFYVQFQQDATPTNLRVYNLMGQLMNCKIIQESNQNTYSVVPELSLPAGMYVIEVFAAGISQRSILLVK